MVVRTNTTNEDWFSGDLVTTTRAHDDSSLFDAVQDSGEEEDEEDENSMVDRLVECAERVEPLAVVVFAVGTVINSAAILYDQL